MNLNRRPIPFAAGLLFLMGSIAAAAILAAMAFALSEVALTPEQVARLIHVSSLLKPVVIGVSLCAALLLFHARGRSRWFILLLTAIGVAAATVIGGIVVFLVTDRPLVSLVLRF